MTKHMHDMKYRAGTAELGHLGISDRSPGWSCSCGGWRFTAVANPRRLSGNNLIEAERAFVEHRKEATP